MTIQEMLKREDIYGIIEKTLHSYYKKAYSDNVFVRVDHNVFRNRYIIYPRIGVIISRYPSFKVMQDVYKQFDVQYNILRKIAAWGYITLCFLTFGLLASRSLYVSKKNYLNRHRYIMPCNRKLRIFYYDKGYVDAILKDGFNDSYFKNEIKYRVNPKYSFIPPVISHGDRWYREEILFGYGLVRVHEPQYSIGVNSVVAGIKGLYKDSLRYKQVTEYEQELSQYVLERIDVLKITKKIPTTDYIRSVINTCYAILEKSQLNVPIVVSHGDLQTGNIFVDKKTGETIVYDWETASPRSIWYDMGRFILYSQRAGRYAQMVNNRNTEEVRNALLLMDSQKSYNMDEVIAVLVLEELVAFTQEICELPGEVGAEIMDRLTVELEQTNLFVA